MDPIQILESRDQRPDRSPPELEQRRVPRKSVAGANHDTPATPRNEHARELFAPLATAYDRWSRILSLGQDPRWRKLMVDGMQLAPGSLVADVASGTGLVAELVRDQGCRVVAVDQSPQMLAGAAGRGFEVVQARAEAMPFDDGTFDGLTFTYLLRYVDDPLDCMRELARVLRPGGTIGMVEFGLPGGVWHHLWVAYTRIVLAGAGALISPAWKEAGSFLGPSIARFHEQYPGDTLIEIWRGAGFDDVCRKEMSLGGGLIMWGRRK